MFNTLTRMGASGVADAYEIEKSLRINDDDSAYLNRTPSSVGDRRTWTFSCWVKRGDVSGSSPTHIFSRGTTAGGDWFFLYFNADGHLQPYFYEAYGPQNLASESKGQMRDPSAWYHIVLRIDTPQATQSNRMRLYINGVEDVWNNYNGLQQDYQYEVNETSEHRLGRAGHGDNFDGYLAEVHFLDGQSLDASHFGEFDDDTGQWVPKEYTGGNYGTNGFYLDFSDNSGATATTLGKDSSGQGNNWTPNNFSVSSDFSTNDSFVDTPTANYATLNPLQGRGSDHSESGTLPTFSQGNLYVSGGQTNDRIRGTTALRLGDTGKYYFEVKAIGTPASSNAIGFQDEVNKPSNQVSGYLAHWYFSSGNDLPYKESGSNPGWTAGDILGVAINTGTSKVTWYKNNSSVGVSDLSTSSMEYVVPVILANSGVEFAANFGGNGSFNYTPPAGHVPITAQNLPEPTIKNPSEYFNTGLYTGDGSTRSITGVGFSPDLLIIKNRLVADRNFVVVDSVRGATKSLGWGYNQNDNEETDTDKVTSLDSDGFSIGADNQVNENTEKIVYWAWKESATAGFDIVSYTGDGTDPRNISHNLGVVPELFMVKQLNDDSKRWVIGNKTIDADENLFMASDDDENIRDFWNNTRPTSSVFTVSEYNDEVNGNGKNYIAYLWASVPGFSKVGTYTGNDSNDGIFLNLGFRPALFLVKNTNDNEMWALYDDVRGGNQNNPYQVPSGYNSGIEVTDVDIDILSNGIKFRQGHNRTNYAENESAYIYIAIARNPFKYANAR